MLHSLHSNAVSSDRTLEKKLNNDGLSSFAKASHLKRRAALRSPQHRDDLRRNKSIRRIDGPSSEMLPLCSASRRFSAGIFVDTDRSSLRAHRRRSVAATFPSVVLGSGKSSVIFQWRGRCEHVAGFGQDCPANFAYEDCFGKSLHDRPIVG